MKHSSLAIANYNNFKKDGTNHQHNFVNSYVDSDELKKPSKEVANTIT